MQILMELHDESLAEFGFDPEAELKKLGNKQLDKAKRKLGLTSVKDKDLSAAPKGTSAARKPFWDFRNAVLLLNKMPKEQIPPGDLAKAQKLLRLAWELVLAASFPETAKMVKNYRNSMKVWKEVPRGTNWSVIASNADLTMQIAEIGYAGGPVRPLPAAAKTARDAFLAAAPQLPLAEMAEASKQFHIKSGDRPRTATEQEEAGADEPKNGGPKKSKTLWWVLGGVAAAAVVGGGIWYATQRRAA